MCQPFKIIWEGTITEKLDTVVNNIQNPEESLIIKIAELVSSTYIRYTVKNISSPDKLYNLIDNNTNDESRIMFVESFKHLDNIRLFLEIKLP